MKRAIRFAFAIAFLTTIVATLAHAQDFKKQVIYQIVTDRFCNGDTSNDNPRKAPAFSILPRQTGISTGAGTSPAFKPSSPISTAWASPLSGSPRRWITST